jgi:hypothetical protein
MAASQGAGIAELFQRIDMLALVTEQPDHGTGAGGATHLALTGSPLCKSSRYPRDAVALWC